MTLPAGYVEAQHKGNVLSEGTGEAYKQLVRKRAYQMCKSLPTRVDIIDIGCREGSAVAVFDSHDAVSRIVGIDIVPEFVLEADLGRAEIYEMDVHDLKFTDGEFHWAFCSHVLEHCYDMDKAVAEIRRVASIGLFLVLPLEEGGQFGDNSSHYFYASDPLTWLNRLVHPDWALGGLEVTKFSDLIVIYIRKQK